MGPLFHFTANFIMVWIASQILGVEFAGAVFVLALVGGLFPDFTHHRWEFILAACVSFGAVYIFAFNKTGESWISFLLGIAAIAVLLVVKSRARSIEQLFPNVPRNQWTPDLIKRAPLTYTVPHYIAFGLAAYLFTDSLAVGIIAFLCYAMHGSIDHLTYGTWFGLRNMAPYSKI